MQIVPRHELPRLLRACGLSPETREFPAQERLHRLTVKEQTPPPFAGGPHRKVTMPDGSVEGPYPIADRPALSVFVATCLLEIGAKQTLATIEEGALWLNNHSQKEYLSDVADAQRVSLFLRRRGLTNRFRGGFLVRSSDFTKVLPILAAQTFSGGSNVLFAALSPAFTVLSCHHFDLHFTSPDTSLLSSITDLARQHGLVADTLMLPEI